MAGTRVPVRSIVISSRRYEGNLERIAAAYRLDVDSVQDALSFYAEHRDEIDALILDNEQAALE